MIIRDWSVITFNALQDTWQGFLLFLPRLIGAIIVFIFGWFLATFLGRFVAEILKKLTFNKFFERKGWREALEKAELKVNPAEFVGGIFKWILVIVFLLASVDILGFKEFAVVLSSIVAWLPNLIVAILIFVVAVILTDILEKIIKASVKKIGIGYVGFIGTAVRWAIYIFAFLAIVDQLGVARNIVNTFVMGFVGMISLAFGLAFGLGGKDAAAQLIEDLKRKIS
ncbi:MAG: mechanosensitive ion channel family protein [Candidatus Nealsonbacteria bacterium]